MSCDNMTVVKPLPPKMFLDVFQHHIRFPCTCISLNLSFEFFTHWTHSLTYSYIYIHTQTHTHSHMHAHIQGWKLVMSFCRLSQNYLYNITSAKICTGFMIVHSFVSVSFVHSFVCSLVYSYNKEDWFVLISAKWGWDVADSCFRIHP